MTSLPLQRDARWLLHRLAQRQPVAAVGVRSARTAEIARLARAAGADLLWVDLEHSAMGVDVAAQICAAALDLGLLPLVRVPEREIGVIGRLLDGGALGIIAPRVETPEQAAELVAACRFPTQGHRSAIAQLPQAGYRRVAAGPLYELVNRATLVKLLVESPRGVANIEAIARVPGVDLLAIGANDLSAELGHPGDYRAPAVAEALAAALEACRRAGKPLAIGGIADAALNAEWLAAGAVPLLMTGIDTELLLGAMTERVQRALSPFTSSTEPASR